MNEDIYQMIDTLHARLDDVRAAVDSLESDAPGFAKRLDMPNPLCRKMSLVLLQKRITLSKPLRLPHRNPTRIMRVFCLTRRRTILRMQEKQWLAFIEMEKKW